MIQCNDDHIKIKGSRMDLLCEFMVIANNLVSKRVCSPETLTKICIMGTMMAAMSEDEIKEFLIKQIDEMDDIGTALSLLGDLTKGGII